MWAKGLSFIKRDFLIDISYRVNFFLNIISIFFRVSFFFFLSLFINNGEDYFSFVLVGIALSDYFSVLTRAFSGALREAQLEGTLEALSTSLTPLPQSIIFSGLYPLLYTIFQIILYFIIGICFFDLSLAEANYVGVLSTFLLATFSFAGFGLLSSIFVLLYKRGDPIIWFLNSLSWLLAGTLYPVSILPEWLQGLASFLPLTHALKALRLALLKGAPIKEISASLIILALFSIITCFLAWLIFPYAIEKVKKEAGLSQY